MLIDENIYNFRIDLLIAIIWKKIPLSNEKNFANIFFLELYKVQLTYNDLHVFKVYNLMDFDIYIHVKS